MKRRFGKSKYKTKIVSEETYKLWIKEYPEYENITFKEFRDRCNDLLIALRNEAVENVDGIRLSQYMGDISIKYVPVEKSINAASSLLAEKEVKNLNFGTIGKTAKVVWVRDYASKFNRFIHFIAFSAHTNFKKLAKEKCKTDPFAIKNSRLLDFNHK